MTLIKSLNNPLRPIRLFRGKVEIHLAAILLVAASIWLNFSFNLLITYLFVVIHEMAHFFMAIKCKVEPEKIEILPFGVTMRIKDCFIKEPKDEIRIALAGPLSNVLIAVFALVLLYNNRLNNDFATFVILTNLAIAFINIMPILPLDGGRTLKAYLTEFYGNIRAFNILIFITKIVSVVLIVLGAYILYITRCNFSVMLIGAFLITNAISEQKGNNLILMREILYSRDKLKNDAAQHSGLITMLYSAPASSALKLFSYNKYYFINVVDENMNVLGTVTETQLIKKIIDNGSKINGKDLL